MNKTFALVAMAALIAGAVYFTTESTKNSAFDQWKAQYGANWARTEDEYRRMIFERNVAIINNHNADKSQTYKMAVNQFTAMTEEEFVQTYLDPKPEFTGKVDDVMAPINADIDWVSKGAVTPVKNQGSCGSCWAFSAVGAIESSYKLKGSTVSGSEQQLVDCSSAYGNQGCNGGWPNAAIKYVIEKSGLAPSTEYPYRGTTGSCQKNGGSIKVTSQTAYSGCTGIQNAIQSKPLSVTVDATNWSKYGSGVFTNCATSINHAVLLVGIVGGAWKIKNSWGTAWGQAGFIRLGAGNTCGVCVYAAVGVNV